MLRGEAVDTRLGNLGCGSGQKGCHDEHGHVPVMPRRQGEPRVQGRSAKQAVGFRLRLCAHMHHCFHHWSRIISLQRHAVDADLRPAKPAGHHQTVGVKGQEHQEGVDDKGRAEFAGAGQDDRVRMTGSGCMTQRRSATRSDSRTCATACTIRVISIARPGSSGPKAHASTTGRGKAAILEQKRHRPCQSASFDPNRHLRPQSARQ